MRTIYLSDGLSRGSRRALMALLMALPLASCRRSTFDLPPFTLYWAVALQDVNGDGRPDLVYTSSYVDGPPPHPGKLLVSLQDPENPGHFLAPSVYPTGVGDPSSLAVADLDGDGRPDLVVGIAQAHEVQVFFQDPATPGTFKSPVTLAAGGPVNGVAAADLNGDGRCDLAVADGGGISLYFQGAGGAFGPPAFVSTGGSCWAVAAADLDGDGRTDLAATTAAGVLVLLQDPGMPGTFLAPAAYAAGLQPSGVLIADFDGDGRADLAVADEGPADGRSPGKVWVLLQDPAHPGAFLSGTGYSAGYSSRSLASADLDGDGKPDLVVGNDASPPSADPVLSLFFQNPAGAGSFGPPSGVSAPAAGWAWSVAVADVDGDGRPDVVMSAGGGVYLLRQDAVHPGQFGPPVLAGT